MGGNDKDLLNNLDQIMVIKDNDAKLTSQEFRRLQLAETELIKELDRVCRNNNIPYVLFAGTMLGAVRHKGYIPWDDDADIAMLREDYERFKGVAHQLNPEICFFQDHDLEPEYLWGYGKIRKVGTQHMRTGQEHIHCRTGIYIDIFPMDDIPSSVFAQILQNIDCFFSRRILWSQVEAKTGKGIKKVVSKLLSHISPEKVYRHIDRYVKKSSNSTPNRVRTLLFPPFGTLYVKNPLRERYGMLKEWFLESEEYEFENHLFKGSRDYDSVLRYFYGDYMTPPPPEKRIPKVSYSHIEY